MKNSIYKITSFMVFILFSTGVVAELRFTNSLAKDVSGAYGYYLGQNYALNLISKKHPSLSSSIKLAKLRFSSNFGSSIEKMNNLMKENSEGKWDDIKRQLKSRIASTYNIDGVSKYQLQQFIEKVNNRAQGNIESPFLETFLLFKSNYDLYPHNEFIDGFKYEYSSIYSKKAKGVNFIIKAPKTWLAKEGNRPNVVQKFVSQNGKGSELFMVLIKNLPLKSNEKITKADIADILDPKHVSDILPRGSKYISSGQMTLENLPGFWVRFKVKASRVRSSVELESIMYAIFYKNKMIQIYGQVATKFNNNSVNNGGFKRYEKLFDLVANSFVISNLYK